MRYYLETTAIILSLSESEEGEKAREYLLEVRDESAVSDLVLSEIYNLPEPLKDRSTRFVVELGVPSIRLVPSCFTLVEKYVYNKAVEGSKRDWALHLATASVRGFETMVTADGLLGESLLPHLNAVGEREGYSKVKVHLLDAGSDQKVAEWFGELWEVRRLSYRATSSRGLKEVMKGIETSALHLMREKGVEIERTGSIEIF